MRCNTYITHTIPITILELRRLHDNNSLASHRNTCKRCACTCTQSTTIMVHISSTYHLPTSSPVSRRYQNRDRASRKLPRPRPRSRSSSLLLLWQHDRPSQRSIMYCDSLPVAPTACQAAGPLAHAHAFGHRRSEPRGAVEPSESWHGNTVAVWSCGRVVEPCALRA